MLFRNKTRIPHTDGKYFFYFKQVKLLDKLFALFSRFYKNGAAVGLFCGSTGLAIFLATFDEKFAGIFLLLSYACLLVLGLLDVYLWNRHTYYHLQEQEKNNDKS